MNKNISKILSKGSPRQRIVLLTTDSFQEYLAISGIKPDAKTILTDEEKQSLLNSFKTPPEIRLYNKYAKLNRDFPYFLMILKETQLNYNEAIAYLIGFTNTWQDYQYTEQTFNRILYEVKEKKLKNKILKIILDESPFLYAELEKNTGGSVRLVTSIDKERIRLEGLIKAWSGKAENTLREAKSYIKAIRDYLTEEDFLIQALKDILNYYEKGFREDKALIPKYSKRQMDEMLKSLKNDEQMFRKIVKTGHRIISDKEDDFFAKYYVFPDYDELEIDENAYNTMLEGAKN